MAEKRQPDSAPKTIPAQIDRFASLRSRLGGDRLEDAFDLIREIQNAGGEVDGDGNVTLYHATKKENAEIIRKTGKMTAKEDGVFFSTRPDGQIIGYGSEILRFQIPIERLQLDDVFDEEAHLKIPLSSLHQAIDVRSYIRTDTENGGIKMSKELKEPEAATRARLEKTIREFRDLESPEDMLKKAAWYDRAAGINDPQLTRQLLGDILRPEPTPSIRKQDVIQTAIQYYDAKTRAKRLLLVADTTDNNEYVCFNITSRSRRGEYPEAVLIPHSAENHFKMDSYVRCNAEYIIATDSVYSDLRKTSIRIGDADFSRVMERYHQLKQAGKVQRVYNTVEPKRDEFDKLKAQVLTEVENYKKDPKLIAELVDFRSKFYKYSINNTILIRMQNPFATYVASFRNWKSKGYSVNKGEHGIKILAPYEVTYFKRNDDWVNVRRASRAELDKIYRHEIETRKATYFTVGYVFDISQTNCPPKDYPRFYNMGYESVAHAALYEALKEFALKSGFDVVEKKIDSIALRGYYQPDDNSITINDKMADSEKLATMIHEFSHGLMHKTTTQPTAVAEFEAECLTNMLSHRLGLPVTETRKDYLATYYGKLKGMEYDIGSSFQRISKAYNHLTEGLDKTLAERGISISHDREQRPEQEQKVTPQQVNENFTKDLEQGV